MAAVDHDNVHAGPLHASGGLTKHIHHFPDLLPAHLLTGNGLPVVAGGPEDLIVGKEEQKERLDQLRKHLSEFEAKILPLYLNGLTCCEIAQKTDRSQKSVDNAIQRIRRKVERLFSSGVSSES